MGCLKDFDVLIEQSTKESFADEGYFIYCVFEVNHSDISEDIVRAYTISTKIIVETS